MGVLSGGPRWVRSGPQPNRTVVQSASRFRSYNEKLYQPVKQLAKLTAAIAKGQASADRVREVLQVEAAVHDLPGARPLRRMRGHVALRDVTFGYGYSWHDRYLTSSSQQRHKPTVAMHITDTPSDLPAHVKQGL